MGTKSISIEQAHETFFLRLVKNGLTPELAQNIAASDEIAQAVVKIANGEYELVKKNFLEFGKDLLNDVGTLTIPKDYNHDIFFDELSKRNPDLDLIWSYKSNMTNENFPNTTDKFTPGKTYGVRAIPLLRNIPSERILEYMKAKSYLKVGPRGLFLLKEIKPKYFIKGKHHFSFDEQKNLHTLDSNGRYLPGVYYVSDNAWEFGRYDLETPWTPVCILFCFYELEE